MLSYATVEPRTLEILRAIMSVAIFSQTRLVGGTSLALQLGHRKSIDLDFFGCIKSENEEIKDVLRDIGRLSVIKESRYIKIYMVDDIKIDFVDYVYKWIDAPLCDGDIRLASMKDIAAMKINAVEGRGTKKDFVDIYFLLRHFTLEQILSFYKAKYPENSEFRALMSLTYFDDAEPQIAPEMLIPVEWEKMKETIRQAVREFQEKTLL